MEGNRREWTVPAQLRRRAAERPTDIAHRLVGGDDLSFSRWDSASDAAARGLLSAGVRAGDRVLLPCSTDAWTDYAVAWAAVLKVGAVAVPVSRTAGRDQLRATWAASGAVCVVEGEAAVLPEARHVSLGELVGGGGAPGRLPDGLRPEDDAEIIYTSGTTGVPKGVVASHENVLHPLRSPRPGPVRTALHSLPPGTTVGQGLLVQPLSARPHRTFTLPRFTPRELLAAVERHRPTDLVLVPAMAIALVDTGAGGYDVSSLLQVRTTSAPIHPATLHGLAELFPAARIRNVYSTTECWPRRLATDFDRQRPTSLGRPASGGQVRIVDADGHELPAGTPGDVQLLSDAPQRRYDGDDGRAGVFLRDGWTRTGDIGRLDPDGYFYLVDRNPDLVNTGGLNVSTLDVEATIMEYPGIVEAAVCGVPHPVLTECVVAAVRSRPGLDVPALLEFLQERKGAAAPHRIAVVEDLPRNFLGKIDKKRLRSDLAGELTSRGYEPPQTPTEVYLADLWAVALDLDTVSATDDFLQIGGSSLTAMEVVAQATSELRKEITVRDLLDTTSLRAFAARVDAAAVLESVPSLD
jgi:acyl-CoA synthetase (AMP-forming)/AMP-acid ligase II